MRYVSRMSLSASHLQSDLFGATQPDLFAGGPEPERKPVSYAPDPADVRAHLHEIVARARAASTMPWDDRKVRFYKKVVPQMALWLPDEEAAQLRLEFEQEIARLGG